MLGFGWAFDVSDHSGPVSFGESDLRLANRGGARISAAEIAAILERRRQIERALRAIPTDASLSGAARSVPWPPLSQLFDAFADIRGVGFSKMTKALYRKRPALIPILDSVVQKYLADDDLGAHAPFGERAIGLVRGYKRDLDRNRAALQGIRQEVAKRGHPLTEVRILDLLIWSVGQGQTRAFNGRDARGRRPCFPTSRPARRGCPRPGKEIDMATTETAAGIRAFQVEVPEEALEDLRRRIDATRWPEKETVNDQTQGVQLATIQALARYWASEYDMRRFETRLSEFPQFMTEIDGLDIHFIHVKSEHENALPLMITHGWPGSFIEMLNVIGPLTDPTAHGGEAEDAFDVVIPSIPGYGYSARPAVTGWDPVHIAEAWITLMRRLGYTRFVAQGGDWGAQITDVMGAKAPPELLGIHSNMPGTVPPEVSKTLGSGQEPPGLSPDESRAWKQLNFVFAKGIGYATEMNLRPQTLYGLADSPVALAAWMLDHDANSYEDIAAAFDGHPVGNLTRDEVLDNITMTWVTNTGISSGRLYWENTLGFFDVKGATVPAAVSVFPRELYQAPRSWAKQAYPNLIYFNEVDRGGHFAAWEEPEIFSKEIRAAFRSLR